MEDFLQLEESLTDEERLIAKTVRQWVDSDVIPHIADCYEQARFPNEWIPKLANLGLFGLTLPVEQGGSGASAVAYGLVCQELERGDSGLRSFVSVQNSLCLYPIATFGSDEQKQRFLPSLISGERIGCFGLTEPNSGSDPASMSTTAKATQDGWVLNGSKLWITNATIADVAIVWAKTDEGVRGFLVEKGFEGFSQAEIKHKMSLRASNTGELILRNCFVPNTHQLPGSEVGLKAPLMCLTQARYGIAWGAMGAAMACYDIALQYCQDRKQFNRSLASFQLVQRDLVSMLLEISKAQTFNLQLGRLKSRDNASYVMVSAAKLNACREALKVARLARNLLGANGISLDYHVIRHLQNLESVYTYEGTDNIHQLIVGEHITGFSAFS